MTNSLQSIARLFLHAAPAALALGLANSALAQEPPIVQPGAPGQAARELTPEEAAKRADTRYSRDDVRFMQDMIPHHQQAVEMAALVSARTNRKEIIDISGRITASQADEIEFMRGWLTERGETAPDPKAHEGHADHKTHMSHQMMGMATPRQMGQLARAKGVEFDKLFLELMIAHHKGAVKMVEELLKKPGAAYDPVLFQFTNDITTDQTAEIERMNALLVGLSGDPRAGLAAGFDDAGEAIWNMTRVETLPKPTGFFDPQNPAGLAPPKAKKADKKKDDTDAPAAEAKTDATTPATPAATAETAAADPATRAEEDEQSLDETTWSSRSSFLDFSNTDMAFAGDVLAVGNYHGFNLYKLGDDGMPKLHSSVVCPGGQGDVSIVGDLLIMSVEQTLGRVDCGLQGVAEDVSAERFRGLRIFDISDLRRPVQVGQVQTCRGSHTHSVVSGPGADGKIIVYNSGTSRVRDEKELAGCVGDIPGDDRTALFRIDVIEIPVDDPSKARIVDSPAVFADPESGRLAGLWTGGDHGDDTQETRRTDQCHDITVFPSAGIAAGACSGNGIIFDISDPRKPQRIDEVTDTGFAYWHSATFNNDGTKVLFTDEWGGGARPRCRTYDPKDWGADAIYDIVDGKLVFKSYYKLPAPQVEQENCVAHNGSIVPVPGRDIFVQAWYQGGVSVIDFTDSANPREIAYFDRGPVHEKQLILGGFWSTYWYNGKIYGTEIARGLDVFALQPSAFLTENEIAAASLADQGATFNPQQQLPVSWPAAPVVARAYADQLERDKALPAAVIRDLNGALSDADKALAGGAKDAGLAARLESLKGKIKADSGDAAARKRKTALLSTLDGVAAQLR